MRAYGELVAAVAKSAEDFEETSVKDRAVTISPSAFPT